MKLLAWGIQNLELKLQKYNNMAQGQGQMSPTSIHL